MSREIPISSMVDTLKFLPSKRGIVLNVFSESGVMRPFVRLVLSKAKILFLYSQLEIPLQPFFLPILKSSFSFLFIRFDKILNFHLLELPTSIGEITWSDFISKGLTDLGK